MIQKVGRDTPPPGRFRRIQLAATGETLDLSDPTLGRPDGLELWDRAAREVSSRDSPTARCLFPQCQGAPLILKVFKSTGTRFAAHFPGEGSGGSHKIASLIDTQHEGLLTVWGSVFDHVGRPVTSRERSQDGGRTFPDLVVAGVVQPTSIEVQLTQKKDHLDRTRKAAELGITAVWNSGPKVDLKDRVPELRFTTTISDVLAARHPQDLRLLGVRQLTRARETDGRGFLFQPSPLPMPMGDIAEQLPDGELVPISFGKARILVSRQQAADFAADETTTVPNRRERPAKSPKSAVRRHVQLATRHPTELILTRIPTPLPPASPSSHLEPCSACGMPTPLRSERGWPWDRLCAETYLAGHPGEAL
ncbi:hypothetical protein UK82_10740 [Frankia sp. ACN1ag]|nr:hypothetical protein UK82_10740 [Frankia sp. ACN1ag]